MRRKTIVREKVRVPDTAGGYAETLVDRGEWWARIEPFPHSEEYNNMQTNVDRPFRFVGRYRRGLHGAHELFYDGRRFNITSIRDARDEGRRGMEILATEVND